MEPSQENRQPKSQRSRKKQVNAYAKYSGLAIQLGVTIAIFAFAGQQLDSYFGTSRPYWTMVLALLGVLAGLYLTLKDILTNK